MDQITKKDLKEFSDSMIGAVHKQLQGLDQRIDKKFQNVDKRLYAFEQRVDKKFGDLEQRMDGQFFVVGQDIQELKQQMNEFDRKLERGF